MFFGVIGHMARHTHVLCVHALVRVVDPRGERERERKRERNRKRRSHALVRVVHLREEREREREGEIGRYDPRSSIFVFQNTPGCFGKRRPKTGDPCTLRVRR